MDFTLWIYPHFVTHRYPKLFIQPVSQRICYEAPQEFSLGFCAFLPISTILEVSLRIETLAGLASIMGQDLVNSKGQYPALCCPTVYFREGSQRSACGLISAQMAMNGSSVSASRPV